MYEIFLRNTFFGYETDEIKYFLYLVARQFFTWSVSILKHLQFIFLIMKRTAETFCHNTRRV